MQSLTPQITALTLGLICGLAAYAINMPLAWMLGPMIGCTLAALLSAPIAAPSKMRPYVTPIIGVLLGSRISSDVLTAALGWWQTALLLVPALILTALTAYVTYRRIGHYDRATAFFSAMPGGLTDMVIMGTEKGGAEHKIALAHATRVLIVICGVVLFYNMAFGVTAETSMATWVPLSALTPSDWAVLTACAVIGSPLGRKARLPAGEIMGPMILSGIAHVTGIVQIAPPSLLTIAALLVIGTIIGCRFVGADPRDVGHDIALSALAAVLMIATAIALAIGAATLTGSDMSETFLAYAPGGVVEMSLLALAIGQDVTYVTVMHLARIFLVLFGAAPAWHLLKRRNTP